MIKEAIDRILEISKPQIFNFEGASYTDKPLSLVPKNFANPLPVNSLDAIIDYLHQRIDNAVDKPLFIHVYTEKQVSLYGNMDDLHKSRDAYVKATPILPNVSLESSHTVQDFIPLLQSCFVDNDEKMLLLKFLSHIKHDATIEASDDGTTQVTQTKTGIARVGDAEVPNPVTLIPYTTFQEVDQPERRFTLRLAFNRNFMIQLIEADGGMWRLTARQRIADYLTEKLEGMEVGIIR